MVVRIGLLAGHADGLQGNVRMCDGGEKCAECPIMQLFKK
jgi:hypothetical protein